MENATLQLPYLQHHIPDDSDGFMAASRRSPLMRDQWRADEDFRGHRYRDHREDLRLRDQTSSTRSNQKVELGTRARRDPESPQRAPSSDRSRAQAPQTKLAPLLNEESDRKAPEGSQEHGDKRESKKHRHRHRQARTEERRSRKHHSTSSEQRLRYPERERSRSRSPRRSDKRDRHTTRRSRALSSARSKPISHERRAQHYEPSRNSYIPSSRRGRSRSPAQADQYRPEAVRRRSRSNERQRHHREVYRQRSTEQIEVQEREHKRERQESPPQENLPTKPVKPFTYSENEPSRSSRTARRERTRWKASNRLLENEKGHRSLSPSARTDTSPRMQPSTRPIQSILDEPSRRSSPPRPIPSFDDSRGMGGSHLQGNFPMHGMKAGDVHGNHRHFPPHIDTRQSYAATPQYMTPTSSHHGSPHSGSPYSQGRGGWGGQAPYMGHTQAMGPYSPSLRQSSYPPPHQQYFPPQPPQYAIPPQQVHHSSGHQSPSFRGGHAPSRGQFSQSPDRRFSASSASSYGAPTSRARSGHFQNLQWTASGGGRGGKHGESTHASPSKGEDQPLQNSGDQRAFANDNAFERPSIFQVVSKNDVSSKETCHPSESRTTVSATMESSQQAKEGSKISFAFKTKPAPPPPAKSAPDLTQKLKETPPLRKDVPKPKGQPYSGSKGRSDRNDPYSERRDDRRDRGHRDGARHWDGRRHDRTTRRADRFKGRAVEVAKVKKIMKRIKQKPVLPPDFASSDSVYYRKPGNESVIGSGTYGKVFKAIHVYTNSLVALKRIRMEGERDGFPVTAVREIKLLQSLKHDNIVRLYEVMVEKNDCFMVFEYLSHDLTGLLNHPTFKLEQANKKHLSKQLFEGLDYLHRRGVLHRDIKAANILVSNSGQLKLADFGLARFYAKRRQLDYTNRVITIWYRSPELLLGETQYGPAVDIWSAACVMIEIFTQHAIFPGDGGEINQLEKVYNILGTPTRSEWPGLIDMAWYELLRPTERKPNVFAEKYQMRLTPASFELLQAMFAYDPTKRPTASDVLEHPYFTTEEPAPEQAFGLKDLQGDWHEFESKALRRENEKREKEARRAVRQEEHDREKDEREPENVASESAKRKVLEAVQENHERESKRPKGEDLVEE